MNTIRNLEFIWDLFVPLQTKKFIERYIVQLASHLPNFETLIFRQMNRIELILTDKNIYQREKELQKVIPSAILHVQELKSTNNSFTDHYSTKTMRKIHAKNEFDRDRYRASEVVSLTIRMVNKTYFI